MSASPWAREVNTTSYGLGASATPRAEHLREERAVAAVRRRGPRRRVVGHRLAGEEEAEQRAGDGDLHGEACRRRRRRAARPPAGPPGPTGRRTRRAPAARAQRARPPWRAGSPRACPPGRRGRGARAPPSRSRLPPTAASGRPPPITLPKHAQVGPHPVPAGGAVAAEAEARDHLVEDRAARRPRRRPRRSPSRKPGAGGTRPMLAATGSTITHGHAARRARGPRCRERRPSSATAPAGTPAEPGRPRVATPLPPAASSASLWPW